MASKHRIISYNILSSHLTGYFTHCDPKNLDAATRLDRIKDKLEVQIKLRSIICLQEVSLVFAGPIHALFSKHNYHFVMSHYAPQTHGYMGIGLAFPQDAYSLIDADITRIGDTGPFTNPEFNSNSRRQEGWLSWAKRGISRMVFGNRKSSSVWLTESRARTNTMVSLRLRTLAQPHETFCVSVYHMPCMFFLPLVMTCHVALAVQHAQRFANGDPLVVAGDWNMTPNTTPYQLIVNGFLDRSDPHFLEYTSPTQTTIEKVSRSHVTPSLSPATTIRIPHWTCKLEQSMRSACAVHFGSEPPFTNNAQKATETKAFVDTLDYVFLSKQWTVVGVDPLPGLEVAELGPFPNEKEPSDHLMVGVTLALESN
eukprot:c8631_g1_i1.p1 GENE.c8631_g1_i1~~c8631_g1_i1.p1  ORF type:complete len:407 (-),score=74.04 c8631_g1_i1:97-1203(-)